MSKVSQVKVTIEVMKANGEAVEHCTITHMMGEQTLIEYANGHSPDLEQYTIDVLENALRDARMGVAGGTGIRRYEVPAGPGKTGSIKH